MDYPTREHYDDVARTAAKTSGGVHLVVGTVVAITEMDHIKAGEKVARIRYLLGAWNREAYENGK